MKLIPLVAALVPPVSLRGGLESDIEDDGPEMLLASIGCRQEPPSSRADGLRVTLANRDRALSSGIGLTSDERDLDALHRRLTDSSQASQHADTGSATSDLMGLMPAGEDAPGTAWREGATSLPRKVIAHMIALLLENADCGWEVVKGWTTYLYSSGLDGHSAQAAKEAMVKRATEELANIIQGIGEIETECEKRDEKERLSCRLNVSNLAAGAEEEDVRDFFLLHDYDMSVVSHTHVYKVVSWADDYCSREIKVLTVRDPSRRTRTAQLDMWTRNAAVRASFLHGSIFGLKLIIELAVGIDD